MEEVGLEVVVLVAEVVVEADWVEEGSGAVDLVEEEDLAAVEEAGSGEAVLVAQGLGEEADWAVAGWEVEVGLEVVEEADWAEGVQEA